MHDSFFCACVAIERLLSWVQVDTRKEDPVKTTVTIRLPAHAAEQLAGRAELLGTTVTAEAARALLRGLGLAPELDEELELLIAARLGRHEAH